MTLEGNVDRMILQTSKRDYTPEEYLEFEIYFKERHEYIDDEIVLITGGLPNHNKIAGNLYAVPCQFIRADLYDKIDFSAEQE
ncbi:MAG: Uma2 family endonuclease [Leptolyngbya sp. Prado105]|jgi:hypothetical protein|nr:Uma2 family endonuclease [Leptolyngbya sp. Prado105]